MSKDIVQALVGVKVLDFGWIIVGGLTTRHLGDHGAQVVRIETLNRPDAIRTARQTAAATAKNPDDKPGFTWLNTSKYSLSLDLKHPRAREVVDRLVRWADVVTENYTPGTMDRLGLGYEALKKIRPDIIMMSSSVHGQTGPLAGEWGMDGTGMSLSGFLYLTGWSDIAPVMSTCSPYGDTLVPVIAATAILAAMDYRRRTGRGQHIDAGMIEVAARSISPAFLDLEANARVQNRTGNRSPLAAPHGVFPCLGADRWCAIAVLTDEEWRSFCGVVGNPRWTAEPCFATLALRKQNEDELERLVSEWTRTRSAEAVMQAMQAAGVAAGVVENASDILESDPQLKDREFLIPLTHPVLGTFDHPTPPYHLLGTPARVRTSPCLGEHNEYVCTEILGMSDAEFVALAQAGVFA